VAVGKYFDTYPKIASLCPAEESILPY
jgi:hypothetical protein